MDPVKTLAQWRQELGGEFVTVGGPNKNIITFQVHPDHVWIPSTYEMPGPIGMMLGKAWFLKLSGHDGKPLAVYPGKDKWLQCSAVAMVAVESMIQDRDLREPGLEFTLYRTGQGRATQFFTTAYHTQQVAAVPPDVDIQKIKEIKAQFQASMGPVTHSWRLPDIDVDKPVCRCPIMDLMTNGHNSGCPEKKR